MLGQGAVLCLTHLLLVPSHAATVYLSTDRCASAATSANVTVGASLPSLSVCASTIAPQRVCGASFALQMGAAASNNAWTLSNRVLTAATIDPTTAWSSPVALSATASVDLGGTAALPGAGATGAGLSLAQFSLTTSSTTGQHTITLSPDAMLVVSNAPSCDDPAQLSEQTFNGNIVFALTADISAPDTTITGCPEYGRGQTARLTLGGGDDVGVTGFECKIDSGAYASCASPYVLSAPPNGSTALSVRARDAAGNVDATPAVCAITSYVKSTPLPPEPPKVTAHITASAPPRFVFTGKADETMECALDGAPYVVCTSPYIVSGVTAGDHQLRVRARNAIGVSAATPTAWTVRAADDANFAPIPTLSLWSLIVLGIALALGAQRYMRLRT
jgi:hypothetical protein